MSRIEGLKKKYYPDGAGDGTKAFYGWIRQYATPNALVLNVGAGRTGKTAKSSLKRTFQRVVGIDLNTGDIFDLAWADYLLEHIPNPLPFLQEVARVLKPGASFFLRTPNRHHYVPWVSRLTPHWFHRWASPRLQGQNPEEDERYPAFYRFSDRRNILWTARLAGFQSTELRLIEPEPAYLSFHPVAFLAGVAYERAVNRYPALSCLRTNILERLLK